MTQKEIYLITAGEYSDYHIIAVFDDHQLAKNFADIFKKNASPCDHLEIETWKLNPHEDQLDTKRKPFFVTIDKDGVVTRCEEDISHYRFRDNGMSFTFDKKINVHCLAKHKQHAIKIANEKRAQILAIYHQWCVE